MPEDAFDLDACLARVRVGERGAANALVAHVYPLVARLARAHHPRTLTAQDLVQEIFLKMFTHLDRYQPRAGIAFEAWVSRLAVNTCLDALRAERRSALGRVVDLSTGALAWLDELVSGSDPRAVHGADHGGAHAGRADDIAAARELVERLLASLPPADRLVIALLDVEERSVAEVAQTTGWSQSLVKVRAFRARRRLRTEAEKLERAIHETTDRLPAARRSP